MATDYRLQVLLTIFIALIVSLVWYLRHRSLETTDNATVQCDVVDVVSEVKGVIEDIHFKDDQFAERGAPLVTVETAVFRTELARAAAALGIAKDSYQRAKHRAALLEIELPADAQEASAASESAAALMRAGEDSINEAREQLQSATADFAYYKQNLMRDTDLQAQRAISTKELESSQRQYDTKLADQAALVARIAKLDKLREVQRWDMFKSRTRHDALAKSQGSKLGGVQAEAAVEHQRIAVAQAEFDLAKLNLERTTTRAKLAGSVTNRRISVGEYVEVGQRIASIVACQNKPWINANFKETQIARIRPGQSVQFTIDTYPDVRFKGTVESISSGSGSTFSVLPPENATGNFTKVVKRMPVKVRIDDLSDKVMRVGASADVTVTVD